MSQHKQQHGDINLQHIVMDFKRNEIPKTPSLWMDHVAQKDICPPSLSPPLSSPLDTHVKRQAHPWTYNYTT